MAPEVEGTGWFRKPRRWWLRKSRTLAGPASRDVVVPEVEDIGWSRKPRRWWSQKSRTLVGSASGDAGDGKRLRENPILPFLPYCSFFVLPNLLFHSIGGNI